MSAKARIDDLPEAQPVASIKADSTSPGHPIWARLGTIAALITVVFTAYAPTTRSLLDVWNDTAVLTYTHGYLVAGICLWLLFRSRAGLAAAPAWPMTGMLSLPLILGFVSVVTQRAGIELGHQILLPAIVWTSILAALGWPVARQCAFPCLYLYFAIPVWSLFNDGLQQLTIYSVRILLRITGIPAYFSGDRVEIPAGAFRIEGGCSGLHFMIVALALAALYGELREDRWFTRFRHLALAGLLALAGNWVRVYTIVLAGHLTNMQHYLITVDHYYFGWLVFGIAITLFFVFSRDTPSTLKPRTISASPPANGQKAPALTVMAAVFTVAIAPLAARAVSYDIPTSAIAALPVNPGTWVGPVPVAGEWQPKFVGADEEVLGAYESRNRSLEVYIGSYAFQKQGKELIGFENSFAGSLREISTSRVTAGDVPVNEHVVVDRLDRKWLLWSLYTIGSRPFASGTASQLWYGLRSLTAATESRAIALRALCSDDCASARSELGNYLEQLQQSPGLTAHAAAGN